MKLFILILFISSTTFAAGFNVTPGLWEVKSTVEVDGKKYDPQAEIKKALANVPESQKKQMMEMMKGMSKENSMLASLDMSKVCITDQMLKDGQLLKKDKDDECDFTLKNNTATRLQGTFNCKDGTKGDVDWTVVNKTQYKGTINATDSKGKKAKVNYQSKFIKSKCS